MSKKTNYFKDKKILVAGRAGFVGTNLIKNLLPLGAKVRATIHKKNQLFLIKELNI